MTPLDTLSADLTAATESFRAASDADFAAAANSYFAARKAALTKYEDTKATP